MTVSFSGAVRHARRGVREYGILLAFLALFLALSFASPTFFTQGNMVNLLDQSAIVGVLACAATL